MITRVAAGWPTLLDRVDWPAFSRSLAHDDPATLAKAEPYTPHGRFALLILADHWYPLASRLRAHETGGWPLQAVPSERLAQWLQATAHVSLSMLQVLASLTEPSILCPPAEPPPDAGPGLYVDPVLSGLPLLHLARELAEHLGGRHHVMAVDLPTGVAGRHTPRLRIEIDLDAAGDQLNYLWLHELGHALDWLTSRPAEQAEDYADTLAELLDKHRPANLDAAASLCIQAHEEVTAREQDQARHDLPARGRESIDAFLGLPLS